ncbi:MAG: PIG-L family deacetylase [Candidatus Aminicenantes bacterium]|nr:PIG-L family deacetylase [Candidatus Aminicenantes bacterium]
MKLRHEGYEIFIPDGIDEAKAFSRTTHLGIGAHPDDLEIMAYDGILRCFKNPEAWFFGIVVTDGAGSPRVSFYKNYTAEEMKLVRRQEQKKAAVVGEYSGVAFLNYSSSEVKDPQVPAVKEDLKDLLKVIRPRIIYTHNPADSHDTHVAVALRTIQALRDLPKENRPEKLYGCEVWRDLDWLVDQDKIGFDVSAHQNLAMALISIYDSQVAGGKGYDLATIGRRRAHATYYASHDVDTSTSMIFAMDLTPLIRDDQLNIIDFVQGFIDRFGADVRKRLQQLL